MSDQQSFAVDLARLRPRDKDQSPGAIAHADEAGDKHGFHSREPRRRGGRAPSPRTGQIHAKVLPGIPAEIAQEAKRRGVQQGVLIEEAWALYRDRGRAAPDRPAS